MQACALHIKHTPRVPPFILGHRPFGEKMFVLHNFERRIDGIFEMPSIPRLLIPNSMSKPGEILHPNRRIQICAHCLACGCRGVFIDQIALLVY